MIRVGDRVRLLRDIETLCDDEWEWVASEGDEGIVIAIDEDEYTVKFHDGWMGTLEIWHEDDCLSLELMEALLVPVLRGVVRG